MRRLSLVDLQLFVNVAEARSVTGGAARTHLSAAAASERLTRIEEIVGTPLLERRRERFCVLPAGAALLTHARLVLAHMAQLHTALAGYAASQSGLIRLFSNTSAMNELLPDVLPAFLAANPGVELEVREQPSEEIARQLAGGGCDIGLLSDKADLNGLQAYPLRADPLALVLPRSHDLAALTTARLDDVAHLDFIGLRTDVPLQQYIERCTAAAGRQLRFRFRVPNAEALSRFVMQGAGIGIVPLVTARRWAPHFNLHVTRIDEPWASRALAVCVHQLRALPRPALSLLKHLTKPYPTSQFGPA